MKVDLIRIAKRVARRIIGRPIFGRSILLYHRVAKADFDPWNIAVSPDEFERQLVRTPQQDRNSAERIRKASRPEKVATKCCCDHVRRRLCVQCSCSGADAQIVRLSGNLFCRFRCHRAAEEFWWDQLEFIFHAREFDYASAIGLLASRSANGLGGTIRQDGNSVV